ncbi:hypothetical protein C0995_010895 [Termitomyces sp. Mi166|nr:hypothetical protein C0995_010895 [Termitomyces sp. Mi166\
MPPTLREYFIITKIALISNTTIAMISQEPAISRLPLDVIEKIFFQLNLLELRVMAATSTTFRDTAYRHMSTTIETAFTRVGFEASHILPLLDRTGSVVSGSFPLMLLNPWTFIANDLDIYVPKGRAQTIINDLCVHYNLALISKSPTPDHERLTPDDYEGLPSVAKIFRCGRGRMSTNIIESTTSSPLSPIFQFHSTAVMNFLSGSEIYCAYPDLTFSFRNLVSNRRTNGANSEKSSSSFESCINNLDGAHVERTSAEGIHRAFEPFGLRMTVAALDTFFMYLVLESTKTRYFGTWSRVSDAHDQIKQGLSGAAGFLIVGVILTPLAVVPVLGLVGFSAAGPVAGTMAAGIQAGMGSVAAGSSFALAQSIAMGGAAVPAFGIAIGGTIASGVSYGIAKLCGA